MRAYDWIERLKQEKGGVSDYRAAKLLGVTPAAVSRYKNEGHTLHDDVALAMAEQLGIEPLQVIADQAMERAKSKRTKAFWERVARSAAVVVLSAGVSGYAVDSQAKSARLAGAHDIYYANRRRGPARADRAPAARQRAA